MINNAVVMGDPECFAVLYGSNPHTRTIFGRRKSVDRREAKRQWVEFRRILESRGIRVHVIPPASECPGLVYPANAGIVCDRVFYPSNLLPARAAERKYYEAFFKNMGFAVNQFGGGALRFEGEADFFPWADRMIFTYGQIERQRTALSRKFPFYRRIYGFRSEISSLEALRQIVPDRQILPLELCDERYYHGDTCLCSFGSRREFLLAYLPALTPPSQEKLRAAAGDRLISLSDIDAACYAANAYAVTLDNVAHLFMTGSASEELKRRIRTLGVSVVDVDVSEFLKKGGGSVKCMVFDLANGRDVMIQ